MNQLFKQILIINLVLISILSFGTIGYYLIEPNWTLLDAFYMTVITITTVGFEEVHDLSQQGEVFTILLIFVGWGGFATLAAFLGHWFIQGEFNKIFRGGHMKKQMEKLKEHYIVCGYGRTGNVVCDEFQARDIPFVVIDQNPDKREEMQKRGFLVIKGDATEDRILSEAKIESAAGIVAATSDDSDNLFIAMTARELNGDIFIISRSENASNEKRMLLAGADLIISPLKISGEHIANIVSQQQKKESLHISVDPIEDLYGHNIELFKFQSNESGTIQDILRKTKALSAVGIRKRGGKLILNPAKEQKVSSEDMVILFNSGDNVASHQESHDQKKRIALVNDRLSVQKYLTKELRDLGHEVFALNADENLLEAIRNQMPDLVILDNWLTIQNAYQICQEMKRDPKLSQIKVIIYSFESKKELAKKASLVLADGFLRKQSKSGELLHLTQELLVS